MKNSIDVYGLKRKIVTNFFEQNAKWIQYHHHHQEKIFQTKKKFDQDKRYLRSETSTESNKSRESFSTTTKKGNEKNFQKRNKKIKIFTVVVQALRLLLR